MGSALLESCLYIFNNSAITNSYYSTFF